MTPNGLPAEYPKPFIDQGMSLSSQQASRKKQRPLDEIVQQVRAFRSVGACPDWATFVTGLEAHLGIPAETGKASDYALIRRADRVMSKLDRSRNSTSTAEVVRGALYNNMKSASTPRTDAIAKLWWPLVMSTNYDDLFVRARARISEDNSPKGDGQQKAQSADFGSRITVLGRSPDDCQQVLRSLDQPNDTILWALHGFIPRQRKTGASDHLEMEFVLGHLAYRKIAHASAHYRRAFAEVYRRRSFFFLGSSLNDPYILDLLSEVQELYGASAAPHFAFIPREDKVDARFLRARFNIHVHEFERKDGHDSLAGLIDTLVDAVDAPRPHQERWGYSGSRGRHSFTVLAEDIAPPESDACAVVSAGWSGDRVHVTPNIAHSLNLAGDKVKKIARFEHLHAFPEEQEHGPVAAGIPWAKPGGDGITSQIGNRDVKLIREVSTEALRWASQEVQKQVLHVTLFGTGKSSHFPARFALLEIARAFSDWSRNCQDTPMELVVHLRNGRVLWDLRAGKIDLAAELSCADIPVWIHIANSIQDAPALDHHEPALYSDNDVLEHILEDFDLEGHDVLLTITPATTPEAEPIEARSRSHEKLRDLGVFPGSVLKFTVQ